MNAHTVLMLISGHFLVACLGCSPAAEKRPTKAPENKNQQPTKTLGEVVVPPEAAAALKRIELAAVKPAADDAKMQEMLARIGPLVTAQHHIHVATSYAQGFRFREALSHYYVAELLDSETSDPHFGKAVVLYKIALLDLVGRGLYQVTNSDLHVVSNRLADSPYLLREAVLLTSAVLYLDTVASTMAPHGWDYETSMNTMRTLYEQRAPGVNLGGKPAPSMPSRYARRSSDVSWKVRSRRVVATSSVS